MLASKRRIELRSKSKWMSCFVALPDSTVFEIDFTLQSDGLEILTKASSVRSHFLSTKAQNLTECLLYGKLFNVVYHVFDCGI